MSKFNDLTSRVQYTIMNAVSTLRDPKRGIQTLSSNLQRVSDSLCWNAEDWMKASFTLHYASWAAEKLENAILAVLEANGPGPQSDVDDALEAHADRITRAIAAECYQTVCRGMDGFSNNPMRAVETYAKVEAAKKVLEGICGFSMFSIMDSNAVNDIIDGRQRREQERKEAAAAYAAKTPVKVIVMKRDNRPGSSYMANAVNAAGDVIESREFYSNVTRKEYAKNEASLYAEELKSKHSLTTLHIEFSQQR